jgi:heat shock protein HslJ
MYPFRLGFSIIGLLCISFSGAQAVGFVGNGQVKPSKHVKTDMVARLKANKWRLVQIAYSDGKDIRPKGREMMTAEFGNDGKITGRAGVNRFTGSYKADEKGGLTIEKLATTRAANPPGSIAESYVKTLPAAKLYLFNKGKLVLSFPYDSGEMVFKPMPRKDR